MISLFSGEQCAGSRGWIRGHFAPALDCHDEDAGAGRCQTNARRRAGVALRAKKAERVHQPWPTL